MIRKNLNGLWDFVVDLDPKYHHEREPNPPAYARPDWNRRHWQKVEVPGVWNKYSEKLDIYEGVCWFTRKFTINSLPKTATVLLRFGAVNYYCRIFLNGQKVGEHAGGYTEFAIDVTGRAKKGENFIAVEVDNRATTIKLPPCLGYFNYGGIHRDVSLEIHPSAYFEDLFLDGRPEGKDGRLQVIGSVKKKDAELKIWISVNGINFTETLKHKNRFNFILKIPDITPWNPENPALYPVSARLLRGTEILHEFSSNVGFRRIEMAEGKITLNNKPIFLKGISYLYDSPAYGLALKPEQFLNDIKLLKEMGVNTIRSHFPFNRQFYQACDRAGIMVWIETPVYCLHPATKARKTIFADSEFADLAQSMAKEMVIGARCHPSVIIYGAGNECNVENPEAEKFFRQITDTIRKLDGTRLLSYAALYCNVGPLAKMVDILGINEYWGWYDVIEKDKPGKLNLKILEDKLTELEDKYNKPMLVTEFGADSLPGYLSEDLALWSEDYHAELLRKSFEIFRKHPVCGTFPFCFSDYRDPSKHVNEYWDGMNYKGVVSYQRNKKLGFFTLKKIYKDTE